jgi:Aspartyl protease
MFLPARLSVLVKRAGAAALSLAFVSFGGSAGWAADGSALLAKHRTFAGWTAGDGSLASWRIVRKHVRSTSPSSDAKNPDDSTYTLSEVRRGVLFRTTFGGGALQEDEGFTGRAFWDTDYNANLVVHFEDRAREDITLNAIFDDVVSTLPAVDRGSAKIDDVTLGVARVAVPGGYTVDLYVAPDGSYRRAVLAPDGTSLTLNIDTYAEALPGKRVIGTYHYGSGKPYTLVEVAGNVTLTDAELLPPHPRTHWTFVDGSSVPVNIVHRSVAYSDAGERALQVDASFNGHQGTFILDSGASGTLLFAPFAKALGLKVVGPAAFGGVNGKVVEGGWVKVDDLALGSNVLHDVLVTTSPNDGFPGVDGLIGFDVLAHALVDVDLDAGRMTILDPARFAPTIGKGASAFPVDLTTRQPRVHVTIGNGVDVKPMFDSGDDSTVLLSDLLRTTGKVVPLSSEITLADGETFQSSEVFAGVDGAGAFEAFCARINQMMVGPFRYENSKVCFGDPKAFDIDEGLIGFDFLRHFNWTFDYPEGKVVLTPNSIK